jgi:DNA polymerase I-like protein with 3'-5' exonuclease and polymerase domains
MRGYLLPDEGCDWTCGDFKAQEPRLAAHFEDGALCKAFNDNPELDPYIFIVDLLSGSIIRKEAKTIFLGLLYSQGVALLAEKLGTDNARASMLRGIIKGSLPDVVDLDNGCKRRFRMGLPIRTLGGRFYFCEPPSNGREWAYKALNTLIQGSAADQTKEALIFADKEFKILCKDIRILGTVHDEFSVSHPPEFKDQVYEIMQLSANALKCDVPMLMDIFTGANWAEAEE